MIKAEFSSKENGRNQVDVTAINIQIPSIGCKARDEGFVFEAIVSSTMQKTGFPVRAASE